MYSLDDFKLGESTALYAVFDDIPFERLPAWKSFVGCQKTFTFSDRYRKKYTVKNWNRPSIFIVNADSSYRKIENDKWSYFKNNVTICQLAFGYKFY